MCSEHFEYLRATMCFVVWVKMRASRCAAIRRVAVLMNVETVLAGRQARNLTLDRRRLTFAILNQGGI